MRSLLCFGRANYPLGARAISFIDESAANERTGWRKFGWSPRGVDPLQIGSSERWTRWSILPTYTLRGCPPNPSVFEGVITQAISNDWRPHSSVL